MEKIAKFDASSYQGIHFSSLLEEAGFRQKEIHAGDLKNKKIEIVAEKSLVASKLILGYLSQHLGKRKYSESTLLRQPLIEDAILEVLMMLSQLENINMPIFILKALEKILYKLHILSGARSILSGNALSFMIELNVFLKQCEECDA